jgi:general secretion pathway protein D
MQERQEFLDRYFVFSDESDYKPPKDYSRTTGLVEEIRSGYRAMAEQARLDELTRPKEIKGHLPGSPLELPASPRSPGGAGSPQTDAASRPASPPNINLAPSMRSIDRIER